MYIPTQMSTPGLGSPVTFVFFIKKLEKTGDRGWRFAAWWTNRDDFYTVWPSPQSFFPSKLTNLLALMGWADATYWFCNSFTILDFHKFPKKQLPELLLFCICGVVARSHHPSSIQSSKPTSCCIVFLAWLLLYPPKWGTHWVAAIKPPGFQGLVERENTIELDELSEHALNDKLKGQMKELVKKYESMQANDGKAVILRELKGSGIGVSLLDLLCFSSVRKRDMLH